MDFFSCQQLFEGVKLFGYDGVGSFILFLQVGQRAAVIGKGEVEQAHLYQFLFKKTYQGS